MSVIFSNSFSLGFVSARQPCYCPVSPRFLIGLLNATMAISTAMVSEVCGKEHEVVGMGVLTSEPLLYQQYSSVASFFKVNGRSCQKLTLFPAAVKIAHIDICKKRGLRYLSHVTFSTSVPQKPSAVFMQYQRMLPSAAFMQYQKMLHIYLVI